MIRATQFPRPNGGDANVTYTMLLSPARKGREPEQWEPRKVQRVLSKHGRNVSEKVRCLPAAAPSWSPRTSTHAAASWRRA